MSEGSAVQESKEVIIQMQPTEHIVTLDGVECRLWNAITARGSQCFVFVHRIALPNDADTNHEDQAEFDELFESWTPILIKEKT